MVVVVEHRFGDVLRRCFARLRDCGVVNYFKGSLFCGVSLRNCAIVELSTILSHLFVNFLSVGPNALFSFPSAPQMSVTSYSASSCQAILEETAPLSDFSNTSCLLVQMPCFLFPVHLKCRSLPIPLAVVRLLQRRLLLCRISPTLLVCWS